MHRDTAENTSSLRISTHILPEDRVADVRCVGFHHLESMTWNQFKLVTSLRVGAPCAWTPREVFRDRNKT